MADYYCDGTITSASGQGDGSIGTRGVRLTTFGITVYSKSKRRAVQAQPEIN